MVRFKQFCDLLHVCRRAVPLFFFHKCRVAGVKLIGWFGVMLAFCSLQSCFTGIESTKKIKLSKTEQRSIQPTPEETYFDNVKATPNSDWMVGKRFIVVGDRGNVMFEPRRIESGNYILSVGDTIRYIQTLLIRLPDGSQVTAIEFKRGGDTFQYIPHVAQQDNPMVMSDAIPGVVDPDIVEQLADLLKDKTLWTLTSQWINPDGTKQNGRKFEPVTIERVNPGDMIYPYEVVFHTNSGTRGAIRMSISGTAYGDGRIFPKLFSLRDPKETYPYISKENWKEIMEGNVKIGMSKEECLLAKGNPIDVIDGRDYSHTHVVWTCNDGTVLHFVDGTLQGINAISKDY